MRVRVDAAGRQGHDRFCGRRGNVRHGSLIDRVTRVYCHAR
jgi:hypothetical protein